jgi:hypothetical protein
LPQYIGIGLSEVFAMTASYEFAYFAAPRSAQSLFMSLRFCSLGISSLIGFGYTTIFATPLAKLNFSVSVETNSFHTSFDILLIFLVFNFSK